MKKNPLLRPLLNAFEEAVCLLDETGAVRHMNEAAERLLGYREDELPDRPLFSGGKAGEGARFHRKDGSVLDAVVALQPLGPDGGGPTLVKFRDGARKAGCDMAFPNIDGMLRPLFDAISDGIVIIDEKGTIQSFTSGAERLFGYSRDEVLGRNVSMLTPSPIREAHDGYLATYIRTGIKKIIGIGREVSGQRKDGTLFPMYLSIGEFHMDGRRFFAGVAHDLTQRKHAEDWLLTLSSAVDQSPAAVLIAALDGRIEYVNETFTRLTGYSAEEVMGQNPRLLQSCHTSQEQYRNLWETILGGSEWRGELEERKKSGETYWALEMITPLRNADGQVTHYLAIQQDITEQKRDKEALAESEARYRQVAEMAGEWLWEQDSAGHYIYSSGAVFDILGYSPAEIIGRHYFDLLIPEDHDHWTALLQLSSDEIQKPFHRLVNRYRHKDGYEIYTESTGAPVFDERGTLIKWRGVDHDITARKAFEDALRVRDRAIEAANVGIVITDAQMRGNPVTYANPALSRITGYSRDELLGQSLRLLQGLETDPAEVAKIRQALNTSSSCEVVLKNYRKDGTPFWNDLLIAPVRDDTGKLTHYIGVQTDVTERRRAEEDRHELEIAKRIQLSLLPDAPLRLQGVEIAGTCIPASHVGGDYFDFFQASGAMEAVIADVSGHSVGAALIMVEARSTLRAETRKVSGNCAGPAQILHDLNELLYNDLTRAELFITMFCLRYEPDARRLKYANAGHDRALFIRRGDMSCTPLDAEGLVLGVRHDVYFEEKSLDLAAGDGLLLYTDGVTEAQNSEGAFFGVARLCALFSRYRTLSPEALIEKLLGELRGFCGNVPLRDDISMVMLKVH